jgi:hypothetical protein
MIELIELIGRIRAKLNQINPKIHDIHQTIGYTKTCLEKYS